MDDLTGLDNEPKFEKNVARNLTKSAPQRGYYASGNFRMRGYERLAGGADPNPKTVINADNPDEEPSSHVEPHALEKSVVDVEAEKEIEAILGASSDQESTGDKKVDDMIDYVILNLQEAGKGLASLEENLEHNLKLMFVELMGKLQKSVGLTQIRLDAARNDIKNLQKALVTRTTQYASKDQEIAEAQKILAFVEGSQRDGGPGLTPGMSFMPSRFRTADGQVVSDETARALNLPGAGVPSARSTQLIPTGGVGGLQQQRGILGAQQSEQGQQMDQATADAAVQYGKGKERRRESELESEVARLRKDNERIAKERADYENAIQRALLRGVSSLNAETLKVLRCPPPVSCYAPCGSPPSPVDTSEMTTTCVQQKKIEDKTPACRMAPIECSRQRGSKEFEDEDPRCKEKRPTTCIYGSHPRFRKPSVSSSHSMAFIAPQDSQPSCTGPCNFLQKSCPRAKPKKLEATICMRKLD